MCRKETMSESRRKPKNTKVHQLLREAIASKDPKRLAQIQEEITEITTQQKSGMGDAGAKVREPAKSPLHDEPYRMMISRAGDRHNMPQAVFTQARFCAATEHGESQWNQKSLFAQHFTTEPLAQQYHEQVVSQVPLMHLGSQDQQGVIIYPPLLATCFPEDPNSVLCFSVHQNKLKATEKKETCDIMVVFFQSGPIIPVVRKKYVTLYHEKSEFWFRKGGYLRASEFAQEVQE